MAVLQVPHHPRWWVVVPMKDTRQAKTRLGGTLATRRQLAILMARDTLCAAANAHSVHGVLVVAEREDDTESFQLPGVRVVVRPDLDINQAIGAGIDLLRAEDAQRNIAVLPGDLPYLRSSELDAALGRAATESSVVVGDRHGTGTTLLTVPAGARAVPAYGPGSLQQHRAQGAAELSVPAWSGLRRDVDVPTDLSATPALGRRTRALLDRLATGAEQVSA